MRIMTQCHVAAPPERVFAIAIDIPCWPEIVTAIQRTELLTPGPVAAGTRFRETRIMMGRAAAEVMTVAEIDPPHRFVLIADSHGTHYRAVHTFTPQQGGTQLTLDFDGRPTSVVARLLSPLAYLMRAPLRRQLALDLDDLRRAAERA